MCLYDLLGYLPYRNNFWFMPNRHVATSYVAEATDPNFAQVQQAFWGQLPP